MSAAPANWSLGERLYNLLPVVHRVRDAESGEALRALLAIIESELERIERDAALLYENSFIETCEPWAIPYIGDLVGSRPLYDVGRPLRGDVARTLYYRRRKATVAMLTELARDVTAWGARVVEFFRLLTWNQHVNHRRIVAAANPLFGAIAVSARPVSPGSATTPPRARLNPRAATGVSNVHVRDLDLVDRIGGAFEACAHNLDVRPASAFRDWYDLRKIGFFLWRLVNFEVMRSDAKASADAVEGGTAFGYHISPLGAPIPLFTRPGSDATAAGSAAELDLPGPIRPLALHRDLEACRVAYSAKEAPQSAYIGHESSLWIEINGAGIPPERLVVMNLRKWRRPPAAVSYRTASGDVTLDVWAGIDPTRGRLAFPHGREPGPTAQVRVTHQIGFSGEIGGGSYLRAADDGTATAPTWSIQVSSAGGGTTRTSLDAALDDWAAAAADQRRNFRITFLDSATYAWSRALVFNAGERLTLTAAPGQRPLLTSAGEISVTCPPNVDDGGGLALGGLLIAGALRVRGELRELRLEHCTLVPGRALNEMGEAVAAGEPAVLVTDNTRLEFTAAASILGPAFLPETAVRIAASDCIIDAGRSDALALAGSAAGEAGPETTLERVTVFGQVRVRELVLASDAIFAGTVLVQRRQSGCMRFSYAPPGSITPRRYRCQPALAVEQATDGVAAGPEYDALQAQVTGRVRPAFVSRRYGDPAYAQLAHGGPVEIYRGAEDGAEMGAFSALRQPQREDNLTLRLGEYLPFELEPVRACVT